MDSQSELRSATCHSSNKPLTVYTVEVELALWVLHLQQHPVLSDTYCLSYVSYPPSATKMEAASTAEELAAEIEAIAEEVDIAPKAACAERD